MNQLLKSQQTNFRAASSAPLPSGSPSARLSAGGWRQTAGRGGLTGVGNGEKGLRGAASFRRRKLFYVYDDVSIGFVKIDISNLQVLPIAPDDAAPDFRMMVSDDDIVVGILKMNAIDVEHFI